MIRTTLLRVAVAVAASGLLGCADQPSDPLKEPSLLPVVSRAADDRVTSLLSPGWQVLAGKYIADKRVPAPAATRFYALLGVAQYAAAVSAGARHDDDEEHTFRVRARDRQKVKNLQAERGAVAAASARVLSGFFPESTAAFQRRVIAEGMAPDGTMEPQFTRGMGAGVEAGDRMLSWAGNDRFADVWTGTLPVGPGRWTSIGAPVGPLYGSVRPYFLRSGDQFRPDEPPLFGSPGFDAALAEIIELSRTRTPQQLASAQSWALSTGTKGTVGYWDELTSQYIADHRLGERAATHIFALVNAAAMDGLIGCWEAKYSYSYIRPSQAGPPGAITLPIGLPNHPSYPSGHSCVSAAAAGVMASFFPEHAAELRELVGQAGLSRMYGGLHYRFDIEAGQKLGGEVAAWAVRFDRRHGLLAALPDGRQNR